MPNDCHHTAVLVSESVRKGVVDIVGERVIILGIDSEGIAPHIGNSGADSTHVDKGCLVAVVIVVLTAYEAVLSDEDNESGVLADGAIAKTARHRA